MLNFGAEKKMSTKSRKKVGFSDDVKGGSGEHESRSRSRSRFRERRSRSQDVRSTSKKENLPKKRDHSLIALVRTGSRNSVRSLVRLFETVGGMNEGRKSQIVLPDERRLDLLIQPKLTARDLLDLVSSHFKLKEKEYFGLSFLDETGHSNWLNLEKRVLEHDLPKKSGFLVLYFAVRFYVASISTLRDIATVELFYLNAKQAIFKGQVESDSDTTFELAAHVLQATHGDYVDEETTKADLKKLPVIPTSALREHPSISFCEGRVIEYYKKLVGSTRGLSIVNYLSIIESLPTYGIHYYEVKDKKDHPWWLGLSYKGIAVYDKNDKAVPRKIFTWKQLENLYYRDKKFSIEVHDTRRVVHTLSSFNLYEDAIREPIDETDELSDAISDPTTQVSVSRRTFGPGNVVVHAWFGITPQLTKCIWSMAVAQHQFYLDRKHSKSNLPPARSVSEIAAELSRSTSSLQGSIGSDNISRSGSSASLPSLTTSRFDLNFDPNVDTIKAQREMFSALKARKEALEETLKKKTEELKRLCIEEGELTGCLSADFPSLPGETLPVIRKRMGTGFSLASKVGSSDKSDDAVSQLELEYELQKQITSAAQKLSQDKSVSKYVRKQRRQSLHKAQSKLKDMEKKLVESKGQTGKSGFLSPTVPSYDVPKVSPVQSPELPQRNRKIDLDTCNNEHVPPMIQRSATTRDLSPTDAVPPLSPTLSSPQLTSYNKSAYKNQMYLPTLSSRSASAGSNMSNQSEYENVQGYNNRFDTGSQDSGFSSNNNMYNLMTQRTSHYESTDEIKTPTNIESTDNMDTVFDDRKKYSSKHGSLDGSYRKASNSQHNYGSLERNVHRRDRQWSYRDRQHSDSDANSVNLTDLEPSKFGSKRNSQSEYDLSTSKNMIEVPVQHEEMDKKSVQHRRFKSSPWEETTLMEPSPVIQSPEQSDSYEKHCYSPRLHEGSFFTNKNPSSHSNDQNSYPRQSESPRLGKSSALVTVTKIQPHHNVEVVSKPFEMSDFYKYSEKIRRQRMIDQYQQQLMGGSRCSSPSQQSTDSGDNSSQHSGSNMSYHHHHPQSYSSQSGLSPSHSTSSIHSPYRPGPGSAPPPGQGSTTNYVGHQGSPFMSHKRDYEQSYGSSHGSPKFQAIKEHSTHVQYTMKTPTGARVYKSVQTKHTHYQPLTPQKCDPIRNQTGSPVSSTSRNFNHNSRRTEKTVERGGGMRSYSPNVVYDGGSRATPSNPCDSTFALDKESVASDFGEEMLAWIDKDSNTKNPSFV